MAARDGAWEPIVVLVNETTETARVSGGMSARARLLHPNGKPVLSRHAQPWPTPSVWKRHKLLPGESIELRVELSLFTDEKAALPPGRYRLTDVRWGQLSAPDVELEIRAGSPRTL